MYAKNIQEVVRHLTPPAPKEGEAAPEGAVQLDFEDEITAGAVAVHNGEVRHEASREALAAGAGA